MQQNEVAQAPSEEPVQYNKKDLIQAAVDVVNGYNAKDLSNLAVQHDILNRIDNASRGETPALGIALWLHQTHMMIRMGLDYTDLVQLLMGLKLNDEVSEALMAGPKAEA